MKIRLGFVSNSSSSSFVVPIGKGGYKNIFELATKMVSLREWDDDKDLIEKIKQSKRSKNTNISFRTCNYNTFITIRRNWFLVDSCNNHGWSYEINGYQTELPEEITELFPQYDYDSGFNLNKIDEEYWIAEVDLMGIPISSFDIAYNLQWCRKCFNSLWVIGSEMVCPYCKTTFNENKKMIEEKKGRNQKKS